MVSAQVGKGYRMRLKDVNLFSLENRRARGDTIEMFKILMDLTGVNVEDIFVQFTEVRNEGNGIRLGSSDVSQWCEPTSLLAG